MERKGENLVPFLQQVPLFHSLPEEELQRLAQCATVRTYEKGRTICVKNEQARYLHIIMEGRTTEFVVDENELSCVARPGEQLDYFGELAILLDDSYLTTTVAMVPTKIVRITKEVFCEVAWKTHSIIRTILRSLSVRLQKSGEKTISFVSFNAEGRLAYMLLRMKNKSQEVYATQESLSEQCGIVRQTVSLILNAWKRNGVIDIQRGKISILELETLADCFLNDRNIR